MKIVVAGKEFDAKDQPIVFDLSDINDVELRYSRVGDIFIAYPKEYDSGRISKLMSDIQRENKNASNVSRSKKPSSNKGK